MGNHSRPARLRHRGPARLATAGLAVLVCATWLGGPLPSAGAAGGGASVSGVVYRDTNDNGVRDAGEPGVPAIRVHLNAGAGTPSAVTDTDGGYTLTGLTAGGPGALVVETGWLRSQCSLLSCAAGPGADNDFPTSNQFIQLPMAQVTQSMTDVDVGLLPDWPGHSTVPPIQAGIVPSNAVDVASRLSWATSNCSDGKYYICKPGDTYTVTLQLLNQGTTAITGLTAVLALPAGDHLASGNPSSDLTLNTTASSPGISAMSAGPVGSDATIPMTFAGSLVPGGLVKVTGKLVAGGSVGTPGCVRGSPSALCPTGEPFGAPLVLAVTHIDQSGDPDSFGPGCDPTTDVRACPTGIHDKQIEPDEVDPVGHNVDASVGSDPTYDLMAHVEVLSSPPSGGWIGGSPITWRVSAFNSGPAMAVPGWTLTLLLPKNSKPVLPPANAMRLCAKGTSAGGYPFVRCTGKGPLSPAVTSIAIDVTGVVPAGSKPQTALAVLGYVQPAAGQPAESSPLDTIPTNPSTAASGTATDNDDSETITIG